MHHYSRKADPMEQSLYLVARMDQAFERLREQDDPQARLRCAQWVTAWAIVAGADAPRGMKLRMRKVAVLP